MSFNVILSQFKEVYEYPHPLAVFPIELKPFFILSCVLFLNTSNGGSILVYSPSDDSTSTA